MPIIALKQKITVERAQEDDWGNETLGEPVVLKARVDESTALVRNRQGEEVACSAQILLDKLADINYDDYITYTDELGRTIREKPIKIGTIRKYSGKPALTEVYL